MIKQVISTRGSQRVKAFKGIKTSKGECMRDWRWQRKRTECWGNKTVY